MFLEDADDLGFAEPGFLHDGLLRGRWPQNSPPIPGSLFRLHVTGNRARFMVTILGQPTREYSDCQSALAAANLTCRKSESPLQMSCNGLDRLLIWRRPTFEGPCGPTIIGAGGLNCRVRDGNGWDPAAMDARNLDPVAAMTSRSSSRSRLQKAVQRRTSKCQDTKRKR